MKKPHAFHEQKSQPVNCYICDKESGPFRTVNGYGIHACKGCGLYWVPGVSIEQISGVYSSKYFSNPGSVSGYRDYLEDETLHRKNAVDLLRAISPLLRAAGRPVILDVGCAYGFLLDEARKKNFIAYGVELFAEAAEYARGKLNLTVATGTLSSAKFQDMTFDAVFLLGTVEHLVDPAEELRQIYRVLKPGGLIVIATLDTKGLLPLFSWKPPEHLFYFSHDNLKLLLEKLSFTTLTVKTRWVRYRLTDIIYRLAVFFSARPLDALSGWLEKSVFKNIYLKIPTNEMQLIARKKA